MDLQVLFDGKTTAFSCFLIRQSNVFRKPAGKSTGRSECQYRWGNLPTGETFLIGPHFEFG